METCLLWSLERLQYLIAPGSCQVGEHTCVCGGVGTPINSNESPCFLMRPFLFIILPSAPLHDTIVKVTTDSSTETSIKNTQNQSNLQPKEN